MTRKPISDMSTWPSLTLEGNLIAPAMIAKIDQRAALEQAPQDYLVRKGLSIREEITTAFRVGQFHFDAFCKIEAPTQDTTRRFVSEFFKETFGYFDLEDGDSFVSLMASQRVPFVIVPPEELLDKRSPTLSVDRYRSPAFALQDYLNDKDEALWGIVTNGMHLRLMRDNASLTRPAYIEADLAQIFLNEDIASFAALWLLIHRSRFGVEGAPATDCALERWRDTGAKEGEVARDRLAAQVETALEVLGSGFLEANPDLSKRLQSGEINLTEWFNELLRLVYRLIFLMVAEDRNLLHPTNAKTDARALYVEGYSLAALRKQCFRAATWDKYHDRYEGVKIVFKSLAHGEAKLALPALGGLFAEDCLAHLGTAKLRNKAFMEALFRLSWLKDKTSMVPVNWRAMATEELGSVYESLLELQPQLGDDGKTLVFASEAAEQKGNQRKITGSYYTPDSLVQALLDTALDPVLDETNPEDLLKLTVIDPACGSGHFLLAAARRIATRLARHRAEGTPSLADFRHALRDVARSCLHGVDRNPMAVELTKVALWIETVDPGLPLGFFDAQIRCGDALLGVFNLKVLEEGIPDAAYKALTGDDKDVAKYYRDKNKRERKERGKVEAGFGFNRQHDFMREFVELRDMPEDTVAQIGAKAKQLKKLTAEGAGAWTLARACDLYVSAFLLPKPKGGQYTEVDGLPRRGAETVPTSGTLWEYLRGVQPFGPLFAGAINASGGGRAFHWPLEFPDVMASGGFDVVLGNPPWERIKLQEKEFFASRDTDIATAPNAAARRQLIQTLRDSEVGTAKRCLFDQFEAEKRLSEATSNFVRVSGDEGGRFTYTGTGDVNTYALFAELFFELLAKNGMSGMVVPTGIATDDSTKAFFGNLSKKQHLKAIYDFENRSYLFPTLHTKTKFCLLSLSKSPVDEMSMSFMCRDVSDLKDPNKKILLLPSEISEVNPNSNTVPIFRSTKDKDITIRIYQNSKPLIDNNKNLNPWHISLSSMFHMTNDSALFKVENDDQLLPLYEAKMFWHFDHRWATYLNGVTKLPTASEKSNSCFTVKPRYWISNSDVRAKIASKGWSRKWMIVFRNISDSRNERTFVSSILPLSGLGNSASGIFIDEINIEKSLLLLANFNSIILDYVARQKIPGTNVNYFFLEQFPILPPSAYNDKEIAFISQRVVELTYTNLELCAFAEDFGVFTTPFIWDEARRADLRAELDAFFAKKYQLTKDELSFILEPEAVMGAGYPSETFRVLKYNELERFGEYRTQRLVLAAWDRMEADGTFVGLEMGDGDTAAPPIAPLQLPPLSQVSETIWQWPQGEDELTRARTQLRAMVGILPGTADARRVRLATLCCLNPALLTGFLSPEDQAQWQRLIGPQAQPNLSVATLTPPTNAAWERAFNELNSSAVLDVSADGSQWSAGASLNRSKLNVDDPAVGRALFAWSRLESLDLEQGLTQLSAEIISFTLEGRLAA